jgi:hypothetical protein
LSPDDADDKAAQAQIEVRRNRWAKWAWSIILIPPSVIGYFVLDFEAFVRITSLVTLVLSVLAMSLTSHAAQKGAEAKVAGYEHP